MGPKRGDNTGKGNKLSLASVAGLNTTSGGTAGEQGH
jgi:hypothetical protein